MSDLSYTARGLQQFGQAVQKSSQEIGQMIHQNKMDREILAQSTNTNTFISKLQNELYRQRGQHGNFTMDDFTFTIDESGAVYENTNEIIRAASKDFWDKKVAPGLTSNQARSDFNKQFQGAFNSFETKTLNSANQWSLDALGAQIEISNKEILSNDLTDSTYKKNELAVNVEKLFNSGVFGSVEEANQAREQLQHKVDYNDVLNSAGTKDYFTGAKEILSSPNISDREKNEMIQIIGRNESLRLDQVRAEREQRKTEMYSHGLDLLVSGQLNEMWITKDSRMDDLPELQNQMLGWLKSRGGSTSGNPSGISDYWLSEWNKIYIDPMVTNEQYSQWMMDNSGIDDQTGEEKIPTAFLTSKMNINRDRIVDQDYQNGYERINNFYDDRIRSEKNPVNKEALRVERDKSLQYFQQNLSSGEIAKEDINNFAENTINRYLVKELHSSDFNLSDLLPIQSNEEEILEAYQNGKFTGYESDYAKEFATMASEYKPHIAQKYLFDENKIFSRVDPKTGQATPNEFSYNGVAYRMVYDPESKNEKMEEYRTRVTSKAEDGREVVVQRAGWYEYQGETQKDIDREEKKEFYSQISEDLKGLEESGEMFRMVPPKPDENKALFIEKIQEMEPSKIQPIYISSLAKSSGLDQREALKLAQTVMEDKIIEEMVGLIKSGDIKEKNKMWPFSDISLEQDILLNLQDRYTYSSDQARIIKNKIMGEINGNN